MAEGQKYHIGPAHWPRWVRKFLNIITLGKFNKAAYDHDMGALVTTKLLLDENDRKFYRAMDDVVDSQENFFVRNYLRSLKHFFIWAVRKNPGHYEGDEVKIKIERYIKPFLEAERKKLDKLRSQVYLDSIENEKKQKALDKERKALFLKYEKVIEKEKELEEMGDVA